MKTLIAIAAVLLACSLWLGAALAHAQASPDKDKAGTSTQVGNAGTITLHWNATQDSAGRPLIVGHVVTYGGKAGYCDSRLFVETLDAQGQVVAQNVGFVPGYVGGYDNVYFELPVRAPGPSYREVASLPE